MAEALADGRVRIADGHDFVHPGVSHHRAELDFVAEQVAADRDPWATAWEAMTGHEVASLDWEPDPRAEVARGAYNDPDVGATEFLLDAHAAYAHAIQWDVTGGTTHAETAAGILDAYADTLERVVEHDAKLLVGMAGLPLLNAAELLRNAPEWAGRSAFEDLVRDVLYPVVEGFSPTANGNWDAAMIQTVLAMGVFLEDPDLFNEGVDYFLYGRGNGAVTHYINEWGEVQESGRDQSHTQMGLGYLCRAAEIGWKQGLDLYGAFDDRLLAGYEYTAKYNLGNEVRYEPYVSIEQRYVNPEISDEGRGEFRPIWEAALHHYRNRADADAPYTERVVGETRPEGFDRAVLSWGTLFADLPPLEKGYDGA